MSIDNEMHATDVALAAHERKNINPPEYGESESEQFIDKDAPDQLKLMVEYFRKHPGQVSNATEYMATVKPQELVTLMLHGNPREIHTFHQLHFIEFFAPRVQSSMDKGEIE